MTKNLHVGVAGVELVGVADPIADDERRPRCA